LFLKSLQLLGFKTFARQTEIQFDGGVTAIVGPNGSGKTNIVDSVKWVLGSGQARDLRGKKMEEVIYAGGERRPRASFAEVTMVFDNTAGRLPLDYHEVAIKRRIERDGESDYYLNGTRVRRRDLIHLLASTGLTVDSYAIIDQHDIEHIVVCSAAERRQLLEEAAQVRGVKQRRQEAAQKLQELAANLLRLEDLKTEIGPRLETLRTQAGAAREAAEATARLELLRGSIVWEEWREARDSHRRASTQQQSLEKRLIEAKEQARIAEDAFQTSRAEVQSAQDRRLARQRTLGQLRLQVSDADHRAQLAEERIENRRVLVESARRSEAEARALLDAASAVGWTGEAAPAAEDFAEGHRLRDVLTAEIGYEAAVAAALGPLLDATVATQEPLTPEHGTTLYPTEIAPPEHGSLYEHVTVRDGYAKIAQRLLGRIVVGRDVTLDGVYREPGLVRSGADDRADLAAQRTELRRQIAADLPRLVSALEDRQARVLEAEQALAAAIELLPALRGAAQETRDKLAAAEHDAPEEEAEMAESARRLVALEEARIDGRLKVGTLDGNLELIAREAELLQAKMDEIRSRMPDGVAPEEIPGGKAREREMRQLERRLIEIGPTNALAEQECRELEERYQNLVEQLEDITKAREDLEDLIGKLRQEEESRYEAVFGAVAANFHEYFSELNPGGRATLRHAEGDDGPRTGVDILVQPPRKRLQNVTLLSSGERSLAALALVLALDEVNPSPFTILDEVDAALDDANVDRFGKMVARLGAQRQFLVITHNHVTMSYASTLYGIHLDESGSSHLVSVRLDDIRKPAARSASTAQAG
jgi:chromosome segregation ATPase